MRRRGLGQRLGECAGRVQVGRLHHGMVAVNGAPTLKAFTDVLPVVVAYATRQYLKHAEAHPPAGPAVRRPRLMGPTHISTHP
ncbi:hypothetical protein ABZ341_13400 [Streptomyces sp. NPDC006173]|uniref:hypothetical protein n=1 Tax=Streptomyces sp. NPDC006173 TaxID=3155349 RepID=UPI0033D28F7E